MRVMSSNRRLLILIGLAYGLTGCARSPESAVEGRIRRVEQGLQIKKGDPPWKREDVHPSRGPAVAVRCDDPGRANLNLSQRSFRLRTLKRMLNSSVSTDSEDYLEAHPIIRDPAVYGAFIAEAVQRTACITTKGE